MNIAVLGQGPRQDCHGSQDWGNGIAIHQDCDNCEKENSIKNGVKGEPELSNDEDRSFERPAWKDIDIEGRTWCSHGYQSKFTAQGYRKVAWSATKKMVIWKHVTTASARWRRPLRTWKLHGVISGQLLNETLTSKQGSIRVKNGGTTLCLRSRRRCVDNGTIRAMACGGYLPRWEMQKDVSGTRARRNWDARVRLQCGATG